ncbi:MAG: sel1 repeat family protein, partial [Acidobacteriia bacterium]|nr:sel1 repeat family protein [Terriglobia bacterium]
MAERLAESSTPLRNRAQEAVKWYRLAAEQGEPRGAYGLGVRYITGQGVGRDYSEAEKWLRVAAEGGHGDAAYNLGLLYLRHLPGQTGSPDETQATKYFRMAADQGIGDGQCYLGKMYAEGTGLPKDLVSAYLWMHLASQNGAEQCSLGLKALETEMKPDQVNEAKRRAAAWKPQPHPSFNY